MALEASHMAPAGDTDVHRLVGFAGERFAASGLEIPAVPVTFHDRDSQCFGFGGVYLPSEKAVRICRPSDTTIVHELAHAWIETSFTETERLAFMELRGLNTWTGGDTWAERGAEQAAEIMTWGLMDTDIAVRWIETAADGSTVDTTRLYKVPDSNFDELVTAYTLLTGGEPTIRLAEAAERAGAESQMPAEITSPEARG